jgi:hypothetical protein
VPKDSIRRLLNHSGGDVTDYYIRDSGLARLYAAEQETISAAIVKAMTCCRRLLPTRGKRPWGCYAAKSYDERPSPHVSPKHATTS